MILPDANVLLYSVNSASRHHVAARQALEGAFARTDRIAFAWTVLLAFVRLSTRASIFERPLSVTGALQVVGDWLEQAPALVVHPTPRHSKLLGQLLGDAGTAGNLTMDAHLAALAIEHNAAVITFDRDFGRFQGLRWELLE